MARIRTIKPEFFQHEALQDLEKLHAPLKPMLVFASLWGHCDKNGVFQWKPRALKLHILPFLEFDLEESLALLERAGQLESFEHEGKRYGYVATFREHQRITGKEHDAPSKYPAPPVNQRGNTRVTNTHTPGEIPEKQPGALEGKGREGGREGKGREEPPAPVDSVDNSGGTSTEPEDFSGQNDRPEDPSPRKRGASAERRNGNFEDILDDACKLLATGVYKLGDYAGLAQALHVSPLQAEVAVRQLRDRGRLPAVAAA